MNELRQAARLLLRHAGFTLTAVLTLGLGIGLVEKSEIGHPTDEGKGPGEQGKAIAVGDGEIVSHGPAWIDIAGKLTAARKAVGVDAKLPCRHHQFEALPDKQGGVGIGQDRGDGTAAAQQVKLTTGLLRDVPRRKTTAGQ